MSARLTLVVYFLLILALVVGGYSLFLWFIVNVMKGGATLGLATVALVAGVSSFFNPCSFPLVPAFLAQFYSEDKSQTRPLTAGFTAALGVTTFNLLLGALLGIAGAAIGNTFALASATPSTPVLLLRGVVGVLLLLLGISHFTGRGLDFHALEGKVAQAFTGNGGGSGKRLFTYGFGYTLLGIGCGGPILTGLVVFALASGGFLSALSAFTIYAGVMAVLMLIVAVLVSLSKESLLDQLRASTGTVKKASGVILAVVGLFLVLSTVFVQSFTKIFFP